MLSQTTDMSRQTKAAQQESLRAPVINSHALLQGSKTVAIVHNGATYQLRATKFGKLILTK